MSSMSLVTSVCDRGGSSSVSFAFLFFPIPGVGENFTQTKKVLENCIYDNWLIGVEAQSTQGS